MRQGVRSARTYGEEQSRYLLAQKIATASDR